MGAWLLRGPELLPTVWGLRGSHFVEGSASHLAFLPDPPPHPETSFLVSPGGLSPRAHSIVPQGLCPSLPCNQLWNIFPLKLAWARPQTRLVGA